MSAAVPFGWRLVPEERRELYTPIGLRLVDDFQPGPPLGRVISRLEIEDGAGGWRATDIRAVTTPSGILTFPGLGRRRDPAGAPRRYRVILEPELYLPAYRSTAESVEFDAHPYDDANPPSASAALPQSVFLYPAANYPFPPHVPVVRGRVEDAAGAPVPFADVSHAVVDRVITDSRGEFALPVRGVAPGTNFSVDALHPPTGASGTITLTLPAAQSQSQTVTIT